MRSNTICAAQSSDHKKGHNSAFHNEDCGLDIIGCPSHVKSAGVSLAKQWLNYRDTIAAIGQKTIKDVIKFARTYASKRGTP